jgi:kynureninase
MAMLPDLADARELDGQDALAAFRDAFAVDDPTLIYLDGNSLGRLPRASAARVRQVVEQEWGRRLIRSWNEGWLTLPQRVGAKLARCLGAEAEEVIVADSTSVNLFKLAVAALDLRSARRKIVTDELSFPSDLYVLAGVVELAGDGHRLEVVRSANGLTVSTEALAEAIDEETALVALCHTAFRSAFVYDLPAGTRLAHRAGALVLWDVSHSVGAMPLPLGATGADLAVGSTYKYLNGGPGAPAFLYVRRDLQEQLRNPIWGWFGQQGQFDFAPTYTPAGGIRRFLVGTPPILSLAAIEPGVDLLLEAGLDRIRAKSVGQTEYLIRLWERELAPLGFTLNTPREADRRGSHVSLGHPEGLRITRALVEEMQVVPDFRLPDNIRLGVVPLYTSYAEIREAVRRLRVVVVDRLFEKYPAERPQVT